MRKLRILGDHTAGSGVASEETTPVLASVVAFVDIRFNIEVDSVDLRHRAREIVHFRHRHIDW